MSASARNQRVLMISATYPPTRCGVGDYSRRLAQELARLGATLHVLTGRSEDPEHQHASPDLEVAVEAAPQWTRGAMPEFRDEGDGVFLCRGVEEWNWKALPVVDAALEGLRPQVLSLQYHGEDFLLHPAVCTLASLARRYEVATTTTFHNLQRPRAWPEHPDPLAELLAESGAWITTNEIDRQHMATLPGATGRLHRVSTGPSISSPGAREARDGRSEFHLAYFGFLNPIKGLEYLLAALGILRDGGRQPRLTLAAGIHTDAPGRLRDYAGLIDHEIQRLQLAPLIHRQDFLPEAEVSRLLLSCDLAVFPFRDGLCGKHTSFWSVLDHGAPALTTMGTGLPEGLVDGEQLLLVPAKDPAALARRIAWAMDHRQLLEGIGESGRRYVSSRFGWERLATKTLDVFDSSRRAAGADDLPAGEERAL